MHLPAEPSERLSGGPSLSNRPIIFVVEDEEDIARLISHNLQAAGFEVQSFVSGASVLTEAVRELPSLFLLDVMLPGTDGFELCRQIRQTPALSAIPIIFLTAKTSEADRVKGLIEVKNWGDAGAHPGNIATIDLEEARTVVRLATQLVKSIFPEINVKSSAEYLRERRSAKKVN